MQYYQTSPSLWVFFVTKDKNRFNERKVSEWTGKQPKRTKLWNELLDKLDSGKITSCGYMLKEDWENDQDAYFKTYKIK
jgi:hypothetical protein